MKTLIFVVLFIAIIILVIFQRKNMKIKKGLYRDAFNSIFENLNPRPKYELDWQYGFPSFTITFESKEVLDLSNGDGLTEEWEGSALDMGHDMSHVKG